MNMPGFTAEASLYRMKGEYAGFSTRASRPGTSSVMAQLYIDRWAVAAEAVAAEQFFTCLPPFCGRDEYGHCHCLTVEGGYDGGQFN
jgi:hypothetical protein